MSSDAVQRRRTRVERLASEYQADVRVGEGRFAAVVRRGRRTELVCGATIPELVGRGELLALLDLDYDGGPNGSPASTP